MEITDQVDLSSWPEGSRLIVRRERPHPGAQLSFTDHDGYRFQAILTDQQDEDIAIIERRHRQGVRIEDRIRDDKDTGLAKFPFKEFALNEVWLEVVLLAHDLIVWTQALVLDGELAKAEPKRLRYRLFHVAGRLAFSARRARLHLQDTCPVARGHGCPRAVEFESGHPIDNVLTYQSPGGLRNDPSAQYPLRELQPVREDEGPMDRGGGGQPTATRLPVPFGDCPWRMNARVRCRYHGWAGSLRPAFIP